ncbi:MAG: hypothetical protein ACJ75S_07065 [Solirubrobacterales bacterium]|jgi:hypothetical protein
MGKNSKTVPAHKIAKAIDAPVPLRARSVHELAPGEADKQVALYEAALRGDSTEFERIRDGGE